MISISPEQFAEILSKVKDSSEKGRTELALNGKQFSAEQFGEFCDALSTNTRLRKLNLGRCDIRAAGAISLGNALKTNRCLQRLYLNYNSAALSRKIVDGRGKNLVILKESF